MTVPIQNKAAILMVLLTCTIEVISYIDTINHSSKEEVYGIYDNSSANQGPVVQN